MKILSNLTAESKDGGQPTPKFPESGNLHGERLSACFSAKGIIIYNPENGAAVLIPRAEYESLAVKCEPALESV